ncbi:MAG: hypothetical protein K6E30_08020 [Lachnospiraceae bacterium]|nr:hypothetical protein [Lachnospiraceae bacterium]
MAKLGDNMRRFMMGRYGMDDLNRFLYGTFIVLFLLELLIPIARVKMVLNIANTLVIFIELFRMLSRNISKRYAENLKFLDLTAGIRRAFRINKKKFDDRKDYRYFKCPGCGQEVRVPKGKGHVRITCPKCRASFEKKV